MNRRKQRGQALVYFGVGILVFFALAALAVDAGRQVFVGREAQAGADSAALAGVGTLARGGTDTQAVNAAQSVALQNSVNNAPAVVATSDIAVGRWDGSAFTTATPHNAVKATPHFTIDNIFSLWSATSIIQRQAIAAFQPIAQGTPSLPIILGSCFTCSSASNCVTGPINVAFSTSNKTSWNGDNAAWANYDGGGASSISSYIPTACGGQGLDGPLEHVGDLAAATNGVTNTLCGGFQSSTCLNHTYLVPIVSTPCGGVITGGTITGFASITLTGTNCSGSGYCFNIPGCSGPTTGCACSNDNGCPGGAKGSCVQKYITVQPKFIDCNLAANAILCQGGFGATTSCLDCGTGAIRLVM
jgi:hypothetical protein